MYATQRLLIFDQKFKCRLDRQWEPAPLSRDPRKASVSSLVSSPAAVSAGSFKALASEHTALPQEHSRQLLMGLTYSLRNMLRRLSPAASTSPLDYSFDYVTSKYRLLYYEPASSWRFIMLVDAQPTTPTTNGSLESVLRTVYTDLFVEAIVRNPLVNVDSDMFDQPGFLAKLDDFLLSMPFLCLPIK